MAFPYRHQRTKAAAAHSLRSACALALVLSGAGCAELERAARGPVPASLGGGAGMRQQRETEMNRQWQNQPLRQLVATLGQPKLTMNIPGGGNPPGFVVVYGEDGSTGCIDAFAVNSGREPTVRLYYCR